MCVTTVDDERSLTLRLRLPDALVGECGMHLFIPRSRFKYGHEQVPAALESNAK